MATYIDVLDALYDVLISVAEDDVGISASESQKHVDVLDRTEDLATPFFGMEWQRNSINIGFGGNRRVTGIGYANDGDIETITTTSDHELIVDIGVLVDGDWPRGRDQYFLYVDDAMGPFIESPQDLHADVCEVRDSGVIPSDLGANADVGVRSTWTIEYEKHSDESATPAESVDFDVDANGVDAYPEHYS
jgi:hypothetical protein